MNTKQILSCAIALLVGLGIGLAVSHRTTDQTSRGMHKMPDGTMMHDSMDMASMMADMNAALAGKSGDEFDRAFLTEMIVHHEGAVEMAELALTNAKRQEIKDLSQAIISAQNTEITQMKNWLTKWYAR